MWTISLQWFHDLMQKAMNFIDAIIFSIKECNYGIHFYYPSKYHAINIMKNSDFLKKWIFTIFFRYI